MSFMNKILDVMKLDPDDDFGFDEDIEIDDSSTAVKAPKKKEKVDDDFELEPKKPIGKTLPISKPISKITPIKSGRNQVRSESAEMEVCVIRPTSIEDEREITDTLRAGRTVVLNVEGLAVDIAQRIIDFVSGSCYAIDGNLQKITNYIFIVTPSSVDISGDIPGLMEGYDSGSFRSEF